MSLGEGLTAGIDAVVFSQVIQPAKTRRVHHRVRTQAFVVSEPITP